MHKFDVVIMLFELIIRLHACTSFTLNILYVELSSYKDDITKN